MSRNSNLSPNLMRTPMVKLGCATVGGSMMLTGMLGQSFGQSRYFLYVIGGIIVFGLVFFAIGAYRYYSVRSVLSQDKKSD